VTYGRECFGTDTMLFEKIRRTQKPVFITLGLVFALSFVFLGVGSGVGGISLGDLLGTSSGTGASISDLNDKVRSNPKDANSWLQLARAYESSGNVDSALGAYQQYLALKPDDVSTISAAATLYESRARTSNDRATYYQTLASRYQAATSALPGNLTQFSSVIASPVVTALQTPLQQKATTAQQQVRSDLTQAIALWKKASAINPKDASYVQALTNDALNAQDYKTAYEGLNRYLQLVPDTPDKAQLQKLLKQLKPLAGLSTGKTTK
jgi:tetratricopeptide (TPR) repeat protein